ncbi:MAG: GHKL domain-containing protein [Deltaproteobacteria bacterium]|nr:GHKL domain-containing protein [Deltaproteobacteria bacterium]
MKTPEEMQTEIDRLASLLRETEAKKAAELKEITDQFIQAAKLTAMGELTAGVAHELMQPLNVVKIICQSMLKDIEKDRFDMQDCKNDLPEIVTQMNRMSDIIDHMRVYTRKTTGTAMEPVNINTSIQNVFKILGQQLRNHSIEVTKILQEDLLAIKGNPIRVEQVLVNIINNAAHALEEVNGKKQLKITTAQLSPAEIVIEIKDNGPGIPDALKEKIMQPFFTTKKAGKGTGLGLSVSSKIIEEHKGRIEVHTAEGGGALFRIVLPVAG